MTVRSADKRCLAGCEGRRINNPKSLQWRANLTEQRAVDEGIQAAILEDRRQSERRQIPQAEDRDWQLANLLLNGNERRQSRGRRVSDLH